MDGRKIISKYENPIDNILILLSIQLGKILSKYSFFTPNVFTTASLIIALISLYYIYYTYYKIGSILFFISYFFDCLDGNFARKYNMVTKFGDLYDHISDQLKYILLIIIITVYANLKKNTKILFILILISTYILSWFHLACQQQYYKDESILNYLRFLCHDKKNIIYTRYIGVGTFTTTTCIFIYNIKYINTLL
mgnify:CR=1 FL=1